MKYIRAINWLIPMIIGLAIAAAVAGLWPAEGQPYSLTSFRGEQVKINARGLYYWDTVSSTVQMQANDLVVLVLGVPLLAVSYWMVHRGSLRGRLLLTGTLGFILYTYITMCFGTAYNRFFLVYVALFSLSLFAFILNMMSFDLHSLPSHFSDRLPRRGIAGFLYFAAAVLTIVWFGRIIPTLISDQVPLLENVTSMFIQVMDLGIIVPLCVLAATLLLHRNPWGYLLASVGLMKFLTMGIAVTLMGLNMVRVGVPVNTGLLVIFLSLALINLLMVVLLLTNINEK
jgi:hypothetical protein